MLQLQTVLQTLAPTSGIERAGDQQLQTVLQTLAPTLGIERAGDQQLQTMLQTLAPTSGIERVGDQQLQTMRVREGRKNQFHIEPMVHKVEYPPFVPQ